MAMAEVEGAAFPAQVLVRVARLYLLMTAVALPQLFFAPALWTWCTVLMADCSFLSCFVLLPVHGRFLLSSGLSGCGRATGVGAAGHARVGHDAQVSVESPAYDQGCAAVPGPPLPCGRPTPAPAEA